VEIFVRPMRYKGCHQAHNAQVVICAFFTTPNSLKRRFHPFAKFVPYRKSCTRNQARQPSDSFSDHHTFPHRGFLHWRFAYAGPGVRRATVVGPASANLVWGAWCQVESGGAVESFCHITRWHLRHGCPLLGCAEQSSSKAACGAPKARGLTANAQPELS